MKSLHTKLEDYAKRCDDIFLNTHLKKLIEEASFSVPQVKVGELIVDKNLILIDVREPEEFASGYIGGENLLTIPRGKLEFMAIEKVARIYGQDANIVTYCLKGPRGSLAGLQLQKMGFTNVSNLEGGLLAWLESGRSIHNYLGELVLKD